MRIKEVSVSYGRTKNLGNYESLRIDVQLTAEIEPGEPSQELIEDLQAMVKKKAEEMLERKQTKAQTIKEFMEDFY